jgi:hypothetical protein
MKSKLHFTCSPDIVQELDVFVGKRGRSKFITEAIKEKISKEKFSFAVSECAGAWSDENHPGLNSTKKVTDYINKIREDSEKRLKETYK